MIKKYFLCIILLFNTSIYSQEFTCGLTNETSTNLINCVTTNFNFNNSLELEKICNDILKKVGINDKNFRIISCNSVYNALAFNYKDERFIVADQNFLNFLNNRNEKVNDYWFYLFILSHEIGHHLNGHTLKNAPSLEDKRKQELECDKFAGMILRKYNAKESIVVDILKKIPHPETDNSTHPTLDKRISAALKGYNFENNEIEKTIELYRKEIEKTALFFEILNYHRKANNATIDYLENHNSSDLETAINYYGIVLKSRENPMVIEALAVLYSYKGDYVNSKKYFDILFDKTKNPSYLIKSFYCSKKMGIKSQYDLSKIDYKNLPNIDDLVNLNSFYYQNDNPEKCSEILKYGIEKYSYINYYSAFQNKKGYLDMLNNLASLYLNYGLIDDAENYQGQLFSKLKEYTNSNGLDDLISKYKDKNDYNSININNSISDYLNNISFITSKKGNYEISNSYLKKIYDNYPNCSTITDLRYNYLLGENYYWLKNYNDAEENLKKVIYSNSFLKDKALLFLGHLYKNKKDTIKANFYYNEACEIGNEDACSNLNKKDEKVNSGDAIELLKKYKGKYEVEIKTYIQNNENWELANNEKGKIYLDLQRIYILKDGMDKPSSRELEFKQIYKNRYAFYSEYGYTEIFPDFSYVYFYDSKNSKIYYVYKIIKRID
jgi:hypothetical protein